MSLSAATLQREALLQPVDFRNQVAGKVRYVDRPKSTEGLYIKIGTKTDEPSNLSVAEHDVTVQNVRTAELQPTLQTNGFELRKLQLPEGLDWKDDAQVLSQAYPQVEALLKEATGASRVHMFDHTIRHGKLRNDNPTKIELTKDANREPVGMVHVDYTNESGIDRLDALLPEEADKLRKTPFAVIQVWRPLRGPVRSSPLGMIDASTVKRDDLTSYAIIFPGRTGYNFAVHHNPDHRWYFADQMQTDEAYVFTCYDSRLDRARFTPHTGFQDLSVGADAPPRESVEFRAYVFWENEAPRDVPRAW